MVPDHWVEYCRPVRRLTSHASHSIGRPACARRMYRVHPTENRHPLQRRNDKATISLHHPHVLVQIRFYGH